MQFDCPKCKTAHEFPDSEIPEGGLVVECTSCRHHIELDELLFNQNDRTNVQLSDQPQDDPRAVLSARIKLDDADWPDVDDSRIMEPLNPGANGERPQPRQTSQEGQSAPPSRMSVALNSLRGAVDFDQVAGQTSNVNNPTGEISDVSNRLAGRVFAWKDLFQTLMAPFEPARFLSVVGAFWVALIAYSLLQHLALRLSIRSAGLGGFIGLLAWASIVMLGCMICAFAAHQTYRQYVEQQTTTLNSSLDWVRGWWASVLGAPLVGIGVIAVVVVIESLIGLLGRIPYAGPVIWGLLSIVMVLVSIAGGLALVCLVFGLLLYVPLIVAERTGPFETLKRVGYLFKSQTARIILLLSASLVAITSFLFVTFGPALIIARELTNRIARTSMGDSFGSTIAATPDAFMVAARIFFSPRSGGMETNIGFDIGGVFAGLAGLLIPAVILAAFTLCATAAGGVIYAICIGRTKNYL